MDYYLQNNSSFLRLKEEYEKYGSLVIAFDFDDTVYDFHKKGRLYPKVIQLLKDLSSIGCHLICWTGNEDKEFISNYLISNNIPFNDINENAIFTGSKSRKIYANAYLDDRAGLIQVYEELTKLVTIIKNK